MNRFRNFILKNNFPDSVERGEWVEDVFPQVVAESNFNLWNLGDSIPNKGTRILLGVALYDGKSLSLLDIIDDWLSKNKTSQICFQVFSMSKCQSKNELEDYIPTILSLPTPVIHPPVLGIWKDGILLKTASGSIVKDVLFKELNINFSYE